MDKKTKLLEERASLIYDFDKVKPENKALYEEIQKELMRLEDEVSTWDTADVKTCPHGYVFLVKCPECQRSSL